MPLAKSTFTVIGSLPFPIDMLRYDACWPARTEDALAILASQDPMSGGVSVQLYSAANCPTPGRWNSFGWTIVKLD